MPAIEFINTLGCLLRDGTMRDALAANPHAFLARLGLPENEHPALLQLNAADLEFQAGVLLRKRFESARQILPRTFAQIGTEAWPVFYRYARVNWPDGDEIAALDACEFCRFLQRCQDCPPDEVEWNRAQFSLSKKKLAIHWVRHATILANPRPALQLMVRQPGGRWREMFLYFGM